jgi:threonyl-tRNA synthetase
MNSYLTRDEIINEIRISTMKLHHKHQDEAKLLCKDSTMESELIGLLNKISEVTGLYGENNEHN